MASSSVIGAVIERVQGFSFPADVTVWFDQAPLKDAGGTAVVPPYIVIFDDGTTPEFDFEYDSVFEANALRFEVYGLTLASVDQLVNVIRYNGGTITGQQGMDFADTLPLTGSELKESVRASERRFQEAVRDGSAKLVFRCTMVYRVYTQRTSA